MKIELKRLKSERCYLEGKIYIDDKFVCDTLEFNNETTLKSGIYKVNVFKEPQTKELRVYILNELNQVISKLVTDNSDHERTFRIRRKNSLIEIGLKHEFYWLIMFSFVNNILVNKISYSINLNEIPEITILNDIIDDFSETPVTSY